VSGFEPSDLLAGPWLLVLLPLALRVLAVRGVEPERPRLAVDLSLALGVGLGAALLSTALLSKAITQYFPLSAADFDHYCQLVAQIAAGDPLPSSGVRLPPPAWLPAALVAPLGLIDALAVQSFLALSLTCAALYLWGLALHGRLAGVCAAVLVGAVGPVGFLARDVSFYPVVVASSTLLAASVAASFRFRGLWAPALAGLAAAAVLLADVRGVLFAGPLVALGLLVAVIRARHWKLGLVRIALLIAPVVASWFIARAVVPPQLTGLERQAVLYADQAVRDAGLSPDLLAREHAESESQQGFVWGLSSPARIPAVLDFSSRLLDVIPLEVSYSERNVQLRRRHLLPWLWPGLGALALSVLALVQRPWRLMALVTTAAPFGSMLWATGQVLPQERHLATGLVLLPLLMGLAVAALHQGGPPPPPPSGEAERPRFILRGVLLAAIVAGMLGHPHSWLEHEASWRHGIVQSEPRTLLQQIRDGQPQRRDRCTDTMSLHREQPWWPSRLYPRARRVLDGQDTISPRIYAEE
jgi:hypothetical protein